MAAKRILVIGGGIAGIGFAKAVAEKAGGSAEVTVVTKDPFYMTGPSRPLILTGEQRYERIIRGYEEIGGSGIRFVFGDVTRIDPGERKVYVAETPTRPAVARELGYDYLLVAPGVVYDWGAIEGYAENWWRNANVYEPGRVDVLKKRVWSIKKGRVIVYAPPMPYRCAPAPSETAMAIYTVLKHRGVYGDVEILYIDANQKPQPPVIADVIMSRYEEAGIETILGRRITRVDADAVELDSGERLGYDLLAMLEPNRAPRFIEEAGLGGKWFEVKRPDDPRSPVYDDVYGAGDAAKLPFPKNQEIAYESSLYAANRVLEDLGVGAEPYTVQYAFLGWAYLGNLEGRLETESVQFGLNFATKPPKPSKDPVPRRRYTLDKDRWEQGYLDRLFHKPAETGR